MSSFAGEYLMNDTEETIYGLRIVFSEPVEITGFGDALMAVEPVGESTEFVFFGGELGSWAGHWFNWKPGSALLINHQWLTDPAIVETAASDWAAYEASRPFWERNLNPTYEEIMAEIAEYPGPEEPLYEPAPDEAIWLTDLEGHADIYDNDSIRINYAEWFDQSQITQIEVYRNGIKMRFLPDMIDILTNEQMKTFDGNQLEHTPASSHTDHAIFGYEYEFCISTTAGSVTNKLAADVRSPFSYDAHRTLNIGTIFQALADYTDSQLVARLQQYRDMGFQTAQIDVEYFVASIDANTCFPLYEITPNIAGDWERTLTPDELKHILMLVKEAGLISEVRVQLWVSREWQAKHPAEGWQNRSELRPSDVDAWFADYTQICAQLARIAAEGHAETFCVGVELSSMEKHTGGWRRLAADLRAVFPGQLTFCEATHHFLGRDHVEEIDFEAQVGRFWDAYDLIEFSCWPSPAAWWPLETQDDQRFSVIGGEFVYTWTKAFQYYRATYPSKPITFGEMGCYTQDGVAAGRMWGSGEPPTLVDHQEMADVWAAGLITSSLLNAESLAIWALTPYCLPFEQACLQAQPGSFFLMASPALRTIESFIEK
jgi:hypothetical protein